MKYFSLFSTFITLAFSGPFPAMATALSLESALREATAQHPDLKRMQEAYEEASWKPLEAISGNLPKLSISADHLFDVKYQVLNLNFGGQPSTFPLIQPKTIVSAGINWTVFDGFRSVLAYQAAKLNQEAAHLEMKRAELVLLEDVRLKYYKALGAKLLRDVADQNLKTLDDHMSQTKALLSGGSATKFDLLRVKVQHEEAVPEKLSAEDNVKFARDALAQSMGLASDDRPLEGDLPIPDEAQLGANTRFDQSERQDLQALEKRAGAASKLEDSGISIWFPRVTFMAQKEYYNNQDYDLTSNFNDAYSVGVVLTWNLFDGGESIAKEKQQIHRRAQAELASRSASLRAPNDIDWWRRRFLYNSLLYRARQRAVEAGDESVRLAKLGFQAGSRTSTDVLDSLLDLFRARAGVVKAQLDAAEAFTNLELALGRKL